jgi:hypothetical protein
MATEIKKATPPANIDESGGDLSVAVPIPGTVWFENHVEPPLLTLWAAERPMTSAG